MLKKLTIFSGLAAILLIIGFAGKKFALPLLLDFLDQRYAQHSNIPLEVVFVAAEKDFDMLTHSIASIRKYLKQPVSKFALIAPPTSAAQKLAQQNGLEFIDENIILNFAAFKDWLQKNHLRLHHSSATWYYQQFLKLIYSKHTKSPYYFIVDADIVFTKSFIMVSDYEVVTHFIGPNLGHDASAASIKKLLGEDVFIPKFSFIADMMCFNTSIVRDLINKIETKFNTPLHKISIKVEQNIKARFSEYELYGVFANFYQKKQRYFATFQPRSPVSSLRKKLISNYWKVRNHYIPYIVYHHYLNKQSNN